MTAGVGRSREPRPEEPAGEIGEMGDDQLTLFDVEPCDKRYVDAPSWPPEPA